MSMDVPPPPRFQLLRAGLLKTGVTASGPRTAAQGDAK